MGVVEKEDPLSQLSLPPGFRFHPTDQELMVNYLCRKVAGQEFPITIIGDVDLYKHDPWNLPSKALFGEKEWYFFSPRDRKYPNGTRPNRVAGSGYWKATGTDKTITGEGKKVGIKKALVFYIGKAPRGIKTNWIMHEYRLLEPKRIAGSSKLDEWVLCRLYEKKWSAYRSECSHGSSSASSSQSVMNNNMNNTTTNNYSDKNNYEYIAMDGLNNNMMVEQFEPEQLVMPKEGELGVANNGNNNHQASIEMYVNPETQSTSGYFYPYGFINPYVVPPYLNQLPGFTN